MDALEDVLDAHSEVSCWAIGVDGCRCKLTCSLPCMVAKPVCRGVAGLKGIFLL